MTVKIVLTDDERLNKAIIEKIKDQNFDIIKNEDLEEDQDKGIIIHLQKNMTVEQNIQIIQICKKSQKNQTNKKVAIIGGAGIGMNLLDKLNSKTIEITSIDDRAANDLEERRPTTKKTIKQNNQKVNAQLKRMKIR